MDFPAFRTQEWVRTTFAPPRQAAVPSGGETGGPAARAEAPASGGGRRLGRVRGGAGAAGGAKKGSRAGDAPPPPAAEPAAAAKEAAEAGAALAAPPPEPPTSPPAPPITSPTASPSASPLAPPTAPPPAPPTAPPPASGFFVPAQVLRHQRLTPEALRRSGAHASSRELQQVHEELRRALFRQALFKVQNVEVMWLQKCRAPRRLVAVEERETGGRGDRLQRWLQRFLGRPAGAQRIGSELWHVDRCERRVYYGVDYFADDPNSFSVAVAPLAAADKWKKLRYDLATRFTFKTRGGQGGSAGGAEGKAKKSG